MSLSARKLIGLPHIAGYSKKLDMWVSHELIRKNLKGRISIRQSLLKKNLQAARNKTDPFLKQVGLLMKSGTAT